MREEHPSREVIKQFRERPKVLFSKDKGCFSEKEKQDKDE